MPNPVKQLTPPEHSAFSLVELSIVLVILGLLVGGILSGQSLIRAAELRSIITQYQKYIAATNSFKDKYFALPGDMPNAQSFWGVAHVTPATCVTTASTDSKTCNGNGDGIIVDNGSSDEPFRFWQHLTNAGLIEGQFDGITHGVNNWSATLANSPQGRLPSSIWFVWNWGAPTSGDGSFFDADYGNRLTLGGITANAEPAGRIITPAEAWNIDTKMDDGKPATGKMFVRWWSLCTDAANSAVLTANYLLTGSSASCNIVFPKAF